MITYSFFYFDRMSSHREVNREKQRKAIQNNEEFKLLQEQKAKRIEEEQHQRQMVRFFHNYKWRMLGSQAIRRNQTNTILSIPLATDSGKVRMDVNGFGLGADNQIFHDKKISRIYKIQNVIFKTYHNRIFTNNSY